MGYTNPKELLVAAATLPAKVEGMLPEGAPKISDILVDTAGKMPDLPDFPIELPDLPELPEPPEIGGLKLGAPKTVREVTATERAAPAAPRRGRTRFLY